MWSTRLEWGDDEWRVHLMRDGAPVAEMSLDEWAGLGATEYLIEDALAQGHPPILRPRRQPT